jgi:multidrug resistance protein MdtO
MSSHATGHGTAGSSVLWPLIRTELAPFPGRPASVARVVLSMALVILVAMTLQVPFLSLSMIMVLFTAQESTLLTRMSGTTLLIGATLAVALGLLLVKFTIDYPLLRILGACVIAFGAMYFMRISRLGAIGYLVALFVFYIQSFVDLGLKPETLLRSVLWFWMAVTYPIVLTIAVYHVILPLRPARLLENEASRQLGEVLSQLQARRSNTRTQAISAAAVARGALSLRRQLVLSSKDDPAFQRASTRHAGMIAAVDRLYTAAAYLSRLPRRTLSAEQSARVTTLEVGVESLRDAISRSSTFTLPAARLNAGSARSPLIAALHEMELALDAAAKAELAPSSAPSSPEPVLVADAFDNPVYGQFAMKTVLAALICYVFYTALHWPGIHTSMLTCFILALPSLGAASHKSVLRVVGCVLGSVVALVATVFIMPHLESITGLLLLTLPIVAAGAWVAAGSPRSNYIGVQFVFAFALAQLSHFGPYSDLTEIRDRMLGILMGVAVSLIISSTLWPERETATLNASLRRVLHSIANLVRPHVGGDPAGRDPAMGAARLQAWSLVSQSRDVQLRAAFEPSPLGVDSLLASQAEESLTHAPDAILAASWLQVLAKNAGPRLPCAVAESLRTYSDRVVDWLGSMEAALMGAAPDDAGIDVRSALDALDRSLYREDLDASRCVVEIASTARNLCEHIAHFEPANATQQET